MWLHVEMFVFMGAIISGFIFMLIRSNYKCKIQITEPNDVCCENTDHLESYRVILELNDSNLTPLLASIFLVKDQVYNPTPDV